MYVEAAGGVPLIQQASLLENIYWEKLLHVDILVVLVLMRCTGDVGRWRITFFMNRMWSMC